MAPGPTAITIIKRGRFLPTIINQNGVKITIGGCSLMRVTIKTRGLVKNRERKLYAAAAQLGGKFGERTPWGYSLILNICF